MMKLPTIRLNVLLPVHLGIIVTFALLPVWYRFPNLPPSFDSFGAFYSLGFLIFWPMLWTIIWWLIAGAPGLKVLWQDKIRLIWAGLLVALTAWAFLSWIWGYTREFRPEVTIGAAIPFGLSALFAIVLACFRPSARLIVAVLVVSLLWNSLIAGTQVAIQGSIDLGGVGFKLDPQSSGISVVEADGVRWLRPYGLLPHPNILGGFLAISMLAVLAWVLSDDKRLSWAGTAIFLFGLWVLLLTFSRSAWLGFAAGAFALLPYLLRTRLKIPAVRWHFILTIGLSLIAAGLFVLLYRPFLSARAGLSGESVEARSISDRLVYDTMAFQAILDSRVLGVGIGNFPWVASYYLSKTTYDLRGQPAHHVLLSAWAELGIIGFALTGGMLIFGVEAALRQLRPSPGGTDSDHAERLAQAVLLSGVIALMTIGVLDHYPWTLMQFQVAWWGLLALAGSPVIKSAAP
jgi:O-Antigen ligase